MPCLARTICNLITSGDSEEVVGVNALTCNSCSVQRSHPNKTLWWSPTTSPQMDFQNELSTETIATKLPSSSHGREEMDVSYALASSIRLWFVSSPRKLEPTSKKWHMKAVMCKWWRGHLKRGTLKSYWRITFHGWVIFHRVTPLFKEIQAGITGGDAVLQNRKEKMKRVITEVRRNSPDSSIYRGTHLSDRKNCVFCLPF